MYSHSCCRPLNLLWSISRLAIVCSKCHHSTMTVSISNLTWGNTHLLHPWDRLQGMGTLSLIPFQAPFPYPLTYCAQWGLYQWLSARSLWGILPLHQIYSQLAHLSLWRDVMHWEKLISRVAYKGLTPSATWVMLETTGDTKELPGESVFEQFKLNVNTDREQSISLASSMNERMPGGMYLWL